MNTSDDLDAWAASDSFFPQEIAPGYYDVDSWDGQPDVKQALKSVADKIRRRAAMKARP